MQRALIAAGAAMPRLVPNLIPPVNGAPIVTQDPSIYGAIRIRGARENNLRNVSLDIPKRRIMVFTGVSGSGKSSLVFGTVDPRDLQCLQRCAAERGGAGEQGGGAEYCRDVGDAGVGPCPADPQD